MHVLKHSLLYMLKLGCVCCCSLGAALAHLYTTALLVPNLSPWNVTPPGQNPLQLDRFRALVTQGQPRLGTFRYNRRLEEKLCNSGNPLEYKCGLLCPLMHWMWSSE